MPRTISSMSTDKKRIQFRIQSKRLPLTKQTDLREDDKTYEQETVADIPLPDVPVAAVSCENSSRAGFVSLNVQQERRTDHHASTSSNHKASKPEMPGETSGKKAAQFEHVAVKCESREKWNASCQDSVSDKLVDKSGSKGKQSVISESVSRKLPTSKCLSADQGRHADSSCSLKTSSSDRFSSLTVSISDSIVASATACCTVSVSERLLQKSPKEQVLRPRRVSRTDDCSSGKDSSSSNSLNRSNCGNINSDIVPASSDSTAFCILDNVTESIKLKLSDVHDQHEMVFGLNSELSVEFPELYSPSSPTENDAGVDDNSSFHGSSGKSQSVVNSLPTSYETRGQECSIVSVGLRSAGCSTKKLCSVKEDRSCSGEQSTLRSAGLASICPLNLASQSTMSLTSVSNGQSADAISLPLAGKQLNSTDTSRTTVHNRNRTTVACKTVHASCEKPDHFDINVKADAKLLGNRKMKKSSCQDLLPESSGIIQKATNSETELIVLKEKSMKGQEKEKAGNDAVEKTTRHSNSAGGISHLSDGSQQHCEENLQKKSVVAKQFKIGSLELNMNRTVNNHCEKMTHSRSLGKTPLSSGPNKEQSSSAAQHRSQCVSDRKGSKLVEGCLSKLDQDESACYSEHHHSRSPDRSKHSTAAAVCSVISDSHHGANPSKQPHSSSPERSSKKRKHSSSVEQYSSNDNRLQPACHYEEPVTWSSDRSYKKHKRYTTEEQISDRSDIRQSSSPLQQHHQSPHRSHKHSKQTSSTDRPLSSQDRKRSASPSKQHRYRSPDGRHSKHTNCAERPSSSQDRKQSVSPSEQHRYQSPDRNRKHGKHTGFGEQHSGNWDRQQSAVPSEEHRSDRSRKHNKYTSSAERSSSKHDRKQSVSPSEQLRYLSPGRSQKPGRDISCVEQHSGKWDRQQCISSSKQRPSPDSGQKHAKHTSSASTSENRYHIPGRSQKHCKPRDISCAKQYSDKLDRYKSASPSERHQYQSPDRSHKHGKHISSVARPSNKHDRKQSVSPSEQRQYHSCGSSQKHCETISSAEQHSDEWDILQSEDSSEQHRSCDRSRKSDKHTSSAEQPSNKHDSKQSVSPSEQRRYQSPGRSQKHGKDISSAERHSGKWDRQQLVSPSEQYQSPDRSRKHGKRTSSEERPSSKQGRKRSASPEQKPRYQSREWWSNRGEHISCEEYHSGDKNLNQSESHSDHCTSLTDNTYHSKYRLQRSHSKMIQEMFDAHSNRTCHTSESVSEQHLAEVIKCQSGLKKFYQNNERCDSGGSEQKDKHGNEHLKKQTCSLSKDMSQGGPVRGNDNKLRNHQYSAVHRRTKAISEQPCSDSFPKNSSDCSVPLVTDIAAADGVLAGIDGLENIPLPHVAGSERVEQLPTQQSGSQTASCSKLTVDCSNSNFTSPAEQHSDVSEQIDASVKVSLHDTTRQEEAADSSSTMTDVHLCQKMSTFPETGKIVLSLNDVNRNPLTVQEKSVSKKKWADLVTDVGWQRKLSGDLIRPVKTDLLPNTTLETNDTYHGNLSAKSHEVQDTEVVHLLRSSTDQGEACESCISISGEQDEPKMPYYHKRVEGQDIKEKMLSKCSDVQEKAEKIKRVPVLTSDTNEISYACVKLDRCLQVTGSRSRKKSSNSSNRHDAESTYSSATPQDCGQKLKDAPSSEGQVDKIRRPLGNESHDCYLGENARSFRSTSNISSGMRKSLELHWNELPAAGKSTSPSCGQISSTAERKSRRMPPRRYSSGKQDKERKSVKRTTSSPKRIEQICHLLPDGRRRRDMKEREQGTSKRNSSSLQTRHFHSEKRKKYRLRLCVDTLLCVHG